MGRWVVWAALLAAVAAGACKDSSAPTRPTSVALLTNPQFVEYDTSTYVAEASELEFTIRSFGIPVTPVIAYDSASLLQTLGHTPVFLVPEGDAAPSSFVDSLSHGTFVALRSWVDSGGLWIGIPDFDGASLVDSVFGYGLSEGTSSRTYQLNRTDANGTPFEDGPGLIWENDGVYTIDPDVLPPEAQIVYQGANGGVVLTIIPRGKGAIILLGYDWYNAAPHGSQDGGWIDVLRRALRY
jgi:hypothetical protein